MKKFLLGLLLLCFTMIGFSPEAEAGLISKKQEIEMGKKVAEQLENQYGVVQDEDLQLRLDSIGQRLVKASARQDLDYTFKVLNNDEINALAVPGGFIYVFRGLIDFMPSDDELAGVLGHEIGHIVEKHSVYQVEKQMTLSLLTLIAGAATGSGDIMMMASTVSQALMAGYSRSDEREADEQGFFLTNKVGYNPYSTLVTTQKLEDLSAAQGNPGYGLFASHPEPEKRVERTQKALAKMNITPTVQSLAEDSATVTEGSWQFHIKNSYGSDKALYRAQLMAGALWLAKQRGVVDETRFLTMDGDYYSDIYYDDIRVLRVYEVDAAGYDSVSDYASAVAADLQEWARLANTGRK